MGKECREGKSSISGHMEEDLLADPPFPAPTRSSRTPTSSGNRGRYFETNDQGLRTRKEPQNIHQVILQQSLLIIHNVQSSSQPSVLLSLESGPRCFIPPETTVPLDLAGRETVTIAHHLLCRRPVNSARRLHADFASCEALRATTRYYQG